MTDLLRHGEAEYVDRQIIEQMQRRSQAMRDTVTGGLIQMQGEEGVFTRASVQYAVGPMDQILQPGAVDIDQLRTALWMTGFRAIVDVHGDVQQVEIAGWQGRAQRRNLCGSAS